MSDNHVWTGPTKADEGWSEWIEWDGELPDIDGKTLIEWASNDGRQDECKFEDLCFGEPGEWMAIKKYRYRLDDNTMTPEEEEMPAEEWGSDDIIPTSIKQLRYQDAKGEDWIDEFARTASVDEFRGAMKFTIGKYNRRAGKKDELIKEIEKMRDYCDRWIDYERSL